MGRQEDYSCHVAEGSWEAFWRAVPAHSCWAWMEQSKRSWGKDVQQCTGVSGGVQQAEHKSDAAKKNCAKKKLILSCKTAQSAWSKSIFMHISHWHSNCSEWNFSVVTHGKPFCVNVWALIIVPVVCWCWHVWFWKEWFSERMVNSPSVAHFFSSFCSISTWDKEITISHFNSSELSWFGCCVSVMFSLVPQVCCCRNLGPIMLVLHKKLLPDLPF